MRSECLALALELMLTVSRGLDFAPADASGVPDDTPIIVVLHGLTGGEPFIYQEYSIVIAARFVRILCEIYSGTSLQAR